MRCHFARKPFAVRRGGAVYRGGRDVIDGGKAYQLSACLIAGANDANLNRPFDRHFSCNHAARRPGPQVRNGPAIDEGDERTIF